MLTHRGRANVKTASATGASSLEKLALDANVIVVRSRLPSGLIACAPKLLGIVRYGVGVDMIPVDEASRYGVPVVNTPKANARSVAEHAVAQMLALTRRLTHADRMLRSAGWAAARGLSDSSVDIEGKTLGLVGTGAVGTELARICHYGLSMHVLGVRYSQASMPSFLKAVTLDEIFKRSDVVVLACPLTDATQKLVDARRLAQMKPGAYLINVARGGVVDDDALADALIGEHLAGAALDVFDDQPLPQDSPLMQLPNVVLSPHMAGISKESLQRIGQMVVEQTLDLLDGRLPNHVVNNSAGLQIIERLERLTGKRYA